MSKVNKIIRKEVLDLKAYHVPEVAPRIKLDAMENPYPLSEDNRNIWWQFMQDCELNRYPKPKDEVLHQGLAKLMQVPNGFEVLMGNGSDEIIQIILMSLKPDAKVLSFTPSFVMYKHIAQTLGLEFIELELEQDFQINQSLTISTIKQQQPEVIFIANPNNPSGNLFNRQVIENIINASVGLVILDEAYSSFAQDSFMGDLTRFDNLLVMRTVSKMGLAGIRLGLLAGSKDWIEQFDKIRLPYNINSLSQNTLAFILANPEFLLKQSQEIINNREFLLQELNKLKGVKAYPSQANFILFYIDNAQQVFKKLLENGILIKSFPVKQTSLKNCLRVTIGTKSEIIEFLEVVKKHVA